jgi:alkylated DNA repair dioxygenase AlkB
MVISSALESSIATAPEGIRYHPDFITTDEESRLIEAIKGLEFSEVRMHGIAAKRRVAHFGLIYGYETWRVEPGPPVPEFLIPLQVRVAALLKTEPAALAEILVTEYPPGSVIGWHRDAPMFGPDVAGVSLLTPCRMRFQRGKGTNRETYTLALEPRSAYVLSGPARSTWQHSIPPVKSLRYSATFRTLRA